MAGEFTPITTQEAFNEAIRERLERERAKFSDYETLKGKAAQFDQLSAQKYPEQIAALQKQLETVQKDTDRANAAEAKLLKIAVAQKKGIPVELAERLTGSTEEELTKDAESFSGFLRPAAPPPLARLSDPPADNGTDAAYAELSNSIFGGN